MDGKPSSRILKTTASTIGCCLVTTQSGSYMEGLTLCPQPLSLIVTATSHFPHMWGLPQRMNTKVRYKRSLARNKVAISRAAHLLCFSLCLLCLPLVSLAQQNKLVVKEPQPFTIKRGEKAIQNLQVEVLDGFHVNSDRPKDNYLIPLKLNWEGGALQPVIISFPQSQEIQVGTQYLRVFTGSFEIRTEFLAPSDAPVGATVMTGKIRYQACSNQMCFRPSSIEFKLPVNIE